MRISHLELTNNCQLRCGYCPHWGKGSESIRRSVGYIDIDLVKKLVERNEVKLGDYIELQLSGEPLLHPQFKEITEILHNAGLLVGLSTNGLLVDKFKEMEHVDYLTISTHSVTDKLIEAVRKLVADKKLVRVQKLSKDIILPEDLEQISEYTELQDYSRETYYNQRGCKDFLNALVVQYDGDVVPCCRAHGKEYVLGNLLQQTLREILDSERYTEMIKYHQDNNKSKEIDGLCKKCSVKDNYLFLERLQREVQEWKRNL